MIEKDYIMRLIQQLTQFLAKVLFFKEAKKYNEASDEINNAALSLIGFDMKTINSFSYESLIELLSIGNRFQYDKAVIIAKLLKEDGEIIEEQNNDKKESIYSYEKSLNLFLDAFLTTNIQLNYFKEIDVIIQKLNDVNFPINLKEKIFKYYEKKGRYSLAENILYDLLENDKEKFLEKGREFYNNLLTISDEELIKGNLPRKEVEEGIDKLNKYGLE